jgi:hypothetical protein
MVVRCCVFVTFLLIVTVDNVFDLLLNFTAMEFVSQLDDAAFFLAGMGYFGSKNADKSEEIEEKRFFVVCLPDGDSLFTSRSPTSIFVNISLCFPRKRN